MKTIITTICIFFSITTTTITWLENLEEGILEAKKNNKEIILLFSGSDWCKPCIELKSNVLNSTHFKQKTIEKYTFVNIDLKRNQSDITKKEISYRERMFEQYNPNGYFPYLLVLNSNGEILKTINGYKGQTVESYTAELIK